MNICVYGASSNALDKIYLDACCELGEKIAAHGHTLVFGGGAEGVMGATAQGAAKENGKIISIVPEFLNVDGLLFENRTELIKSETMRDRKELLEEKSDAFVVAPGGIGTFDEFFEILTLKQLSRHNKAIVIFNVNHYFDSMVDMLENGIDKKFIRGQVRELYKVSDNTDEVIEYLEGYIPKNYDIVELKHIESTR